MQILSFNSRVEQRYNIKCLGITNVIGQINIIINKMCICNILLRILAGNDCLKSGTHGHHQRMGFLLCDALPGLYCSWLQLLFVCGLKTFSFVFSKWNACSIGLRSGDWFGHCRIIHIFYLQKLLGCFCCMFWVIVHLYYEAPPNQLCSIWLNLGREFKNSSGCFCLLSRHH